ncbi:MAG: hypothetical protein JXA21_25565 [Anaerolineae bacterium]|nr:hypothetical protein [Anaerolineae bacterium]
MNTRTFLTIGAVGFAVAVLAFPALAVAVWPIGLVDPIQAILSGQVTPGMDAFDRYLATLPACYAIDDIFIIGWMVGWLGVVVLVRERQRLLGNIVLVLGMAGPILDFTENEIGWALIGVCQQGTPAPDGWLVAWQAIRQVSFMIPYSAMVLACPAIWSRRILDRIVVGIGTVGFVVPIMGAYIPDLWLWVLAWWLIWFAGLGLVLWQRRTDFPPPDLQC